MKIGKFWVAALVSLYMGACTNPTPKMNDTKKTATEQLWDTFSYTQSDTPLNLDTIERKKYALEKIPQDELTQIKDIIKKDIPETNTMTEKINAAIDEWFMKWGYQWWISALKAYLEKNHPAAYRKCMDEKEDLVKIRAVLQELDMAYIIDSFQGDKPVVLPAVQVQMKDHTISFVNSPAMPWYGFASAWGSIINLYECKQGYELWEEVVDTLAGYFDKKGEKDIAGYYRTLFVPYEQTVLDKVYQELYNLESSNEMGSDIASMKISGETFLLTVRMEICIGLAQDYAGSIAYAQQTVGPEYVKMSKEYYQCFMKHMKKSVVIDDFTEEEIQGIQASGDPDDVKRLLNKRVIAVLKENPKLLTDMVQDFISHEKSR